jgi:prepilin peptidase CpaA
MLANLNNIILIILLFIAAFFDVKEKRIPNWLTFPIILIGLILNIIMNGLNGCLFSFYGFLIGLAVFFIPFALGLMGAGDVKLMAAIGSLMGWKFTVLSSLFSAVAGIIVVFGYLIYKKELFSYFRKYFVAIAKAILKYINFSDKNIVGTKLKKFAYSKEIEIGIKKNEKLYVPYGLAIALGTLFVLSGIFKRYLLF